MRRIPARPEPHPNPRDYRLDHGDPREAWRVLGAHPEVRDGTLGTRFAVWAPRASAVAVAGNWNQWSGDRLDRAEASGIWHGFVEGVGSGDPYKFAVTSPGDGLEVLKADPFARWAEVRPANASRVCQPSGFEWSDGAWMAARADRQSTDAPITIYECHLGSWQRSPETPDLALGYRDVAHRLADHVVDMGYTHVELLPLTEYPYDPSWGYQVTGYFAPTSRYGRPDDFRYLVDHLHQRGIGVILDWVPAHFCKDAHGLGRFDGMPLFEHPDPIRGQHLGWGTYVFDYGRPEVRTFLLSSALWWLEEFHLDGLRVDAVATMIWLDHGRAPGQWRPNDRGTTGNDEAIDFLRRLNALVHRDVPGALMFAEEASAYRWVTRSRPGGAPVTAGGPPASPGTVAPVDAANPSPVMQGPPAFMTDGGPSLGFDVKWNMGWMNDTLAYFATEASARPAMASHLTFPVWYAFDEQFVLPLSHDEVVHLKRALLTKLPGTDTERFAGLRGLHAYQYAHPGKKLLFMGGELGQWAEWQEDRSLDWHLLHLAGEDGSQTRLHRGIQSLVRALNGIYRGIPALHVRDSRADGFEWLRTDTVEQGTMAFARFGNAGDDPVAIACNFSGGAVTFAFRVPVAGAWREVLNTDDPSHGGAGLVNAGVLRTRRRAIGDDGHVGGPIRPREGQGGGPWLPVLELDLAPHAVAFVTPAGVALPSPAAAGEGARTRITKG